METVFKYFIHWSSVDDQKIGYLLFQYVYVLMTSTKRNSQGSEKTAKYEKRGKYWPYCTR